MPRIELEPSDKEMANRWQMFTKFMLNRVDTGTLKRLIDDIKDGRNYVVNEEGNIVEDESSLIERANDDVQMRVIKKLEDTEEPIDVAERLYKKYSEKNSLPGFSSIERKAKVEVLEELLDEVDPNYE